MSETTVEKTLLVLRKYYPVIVAITAIHTVHFLQLRHLLLQELSYLSDATFFLDVTVEFFWAVVIAGVIARFLAVLISAFGFGSLFYTIAFSWFAALDAFKSPKCEYDRKAQYFKKNAIGFFVENSMLFEILIFALLSFGIYSMFIFSWTWLIYVACLLFAWKMISGQFLGWAVKINHLSKLNGITGFIRENGWKPRPLLIVALTCILFSILFAVTRAYALRNQGCSEVIWTNHQSECIIIVGKSSQGIFGYETDNLDHPIFVPFGAIKAISAYEVGEAA